jgi:hypothetical protein
LNDLVIADHNHCQKDERNEERQEEDEPGQRSVSVLAHQVQDKGPEQNVNTVQDKDNGIVAYITTVISDTELVGGIEISHPH